MRQRKITNAMQEVASEILVRLIFTKDMEDVYALYKEIFEKYKLNEDPFTQLPCSDREYAKSCDEYYRQSMEDKYGYWE